MNFLVSVYLKDLSMLRSCAAINMDLRIGDNCIVDDGRERHYGAVWERLAPLELIPDAESLPHIVRIATEQDDFRRKIKTQKEEIAHAYCEEQIRAYDLNMELIKTRYSFDEDKIIFYFRSPDRVDFRELLYNLEKKFNVDIWLEQTGPREEARMFHCLDDCGCASCCSLFLGEFKSIPGYMLKDLDINPSHLKSGVCGRLKCCFLFEGEGFAADANNAASKQ